MPLNIIDNGSPVFTYTGTGESNDPYNFNMYQPQSVGGYNLIFQATQAGRIEISSAGLAGGSIAIWRGNPSVAGSNIIYESIGSFWNFTGSFDLIQNQQCWIVFNPVTSGDYASLNVSFVSYDTECFFGWQDFTSCSVNTGNPSPYVISASNGTYISGAFSVHVYGSLSNIPYTIALINPQTNQPDSFGIKSGDILTISGNLPNCAGTKTIDGSYYVNSVGPIAGTSLIGLNLSCATNQPNPTPISLKVLDQPSVYQSGSLLTQQPSVGIVDGQNNFLTGYNTDVQATLIVLSGSATLTGTTTVSTVNGVAYFTDLIITGNGLFYIQFDSLILSINSTNSNEIFFPPDAGNPNPPIPVKPKRSYIPGSVPTAANLEINEFAINVADRKGYIRDSNDIVHLLFDGYASGNQSGGTVYSVGISSTDLNVSNSPITSSGFIGLNLNTQTLTAATYGDASNVPEVTVNNKGIVTGIKNVSISYPVNSITAGTDISLTGTAPDYTINNTAPDQIVSITSGTGISVTGTYPDFTVDSTITQYTDADARLSLSAGTGISYDNTTGVITNSEPDQVVSLTGGTDISVTGTYPNFTIDNDAPDQIVSLTGGTDIGVTGTYPNFTIDYTGTAGTGTVTSVGITSTAAALTITNSPITTSGDIGVNFAGKGSEYVTGDGSLKTFPTTIDQALNLVTEVYNSTGSTLTKGTVVYINGGQGNLPTVTKAQANSDANSAQTYGVVQSDITNNNNGYVVVIGMLSDIDTQSYSAGTQLYLSPTTAGAWTTTKPSAPNHLVYVGIVVYSHPTQGVVEIKIQNGYELDELHDVSITSVASNNILRYNSSTKVWENVAGTTSSISEGTNLYYTDARARLSLSAGTGISYNNTTGVITNSSPDQTVVLTAGTGISTSGTYPNFTITNSAPDQTVKLTAGTGISTSGAYPNFTITNSSPDQTVTLTAGSGISVTGTYPSFTIGSTITQYTDTDARKSISAGTGISYDNTTGVITNDAPDQTVSLTAGTDISITGTYPNFTIGYSGTSSGGVTSIIAGTGISVDVSTGDVTVTNTDPDQVVSLTAGTSISITGTYPSFTITNDDPDQVVSLTAGTGISVTGTYPSFTISNSSPSSGGTVTSIATTSPITGGTITNSGTIGINASSTNTASYVVQRDASGNFAAGTITASLTGTASTATNIANGGAGQLPYNTGSGATSFLAAGTSGQVLRSNGTSAPSWEVQGLFSSGRLTLQSGVAIPVTDQTSKTSIYYTPYNGDKISLYDPNTSTWSTYTFSELTLNIGTIPNNTNFDVFIYNNSGTLTLVSVSWSSDTSRSTSLTLTNGIYLKSDALTRRYLGTFRTTSSTTTEDSNSKRFLWNYNNRVNRMLLKQYVASSWSWSGTANVYRYLGNNSANSVAFVNGVQEDNIFVMAAVGSSGSGIQRQLAIGFDSEWSSTLAGNSTSQYEATAVQAEASNESYQSFANRIAGLGYHVAYALELQNSTTTVNYFGGVEAGISGTWRC